jgi:hypothetical protein
MRHEPLDPRPPEEDPVLHQHLVLLEQFSPRLGFADRVLLNVWLPLPPYLAGIRERAQSLLAARRIWLFAAPFLVGAAVTLVSTVVFVATHPQFVATAWGWFVQHGILVAWQAATSALAGLLATLLAMLGVGSLSGATVAAVASTAVVLWLVCAWGLSRTLRTDVLHRNSLHAQR